ncbi:MAG: D-glycero-beta-D-manno-heptose 1-phosphate adenylyltransferase [Desulfamplus sp.]|nr:D-glycero-beta-D-manno-heptose 1-phosphate adenylyltransferase [Desulfamplus sp.]
MKIEKIVPYKKIGDFARAHKALGRSIVFTNGCFDILHAGHVTYLEEASQYADILIIGLNSDVSVKLIKGESRPIICQEQRLKVLAGLGCVDHVTLFDEPDPARLIEKIVPDVLVKGADWPEEAIVGSKTVKKAGGRVERVDIVPDISTTKIIDKIRHIYGKNN